MLTSLLVAVALGGPAVADKADPTKQDPRFVPVPADKIDPALAAALVKVHERWAAVVEEYGPMYCPPVALGALMPVKIGLALARLARWSGVPLPWLHHGFTVACARRDARTAIREGRAA